MSRISRRVSTIVPPKKERWINTQQASILFGGSIVLNSILLGIETDHRPETHSALSQPSWFAIDSAFNVIYLVEFVLRVEADRAAWCCDLWNVFDGMLLLIGVTDIWIIGISGISSDIGVLSILRIFRLLRLTRLVRMVSMFAALHELWLLLNAIVGAMAAMAWSLLLISAVLFISAMFTTRLVGQDCCLEDSTFTDVRFQEWFGTVPRSLFTLFQFATLENWPTIARRAFDESPLLVLFIIVFIMLTNIMLFNTVAGIVVETVLSVAQREEARRNKIMEEQKRKDLRDLFDRMDTDNDGTLEWSELQQKASHLRPAGSRSANLWRNHSTVEGTETMLDLTLEHANLSAVDAKELYRILDTDGSGSIDKEEFVESVMFASVTPTAMNLLQLSSNVNRTGRMLKAVASKLQALDSNLWRLCQQLPRSSELRGGSTTASGARRPQSAGAPAAELGVLRRDMLEALDGFEERLAAQLRRRGRPGLLQPPTCVDSWEEVMEEKPGYGRMEAPQALRLQELGKGRSELSSEIDMSTMRL